MSELEKGMAHLREGTEVLRTGGGIYLTSGECNAILDFVETLESAIKKAVKENRSVRLEVADDNHND
jgi:hypothetical protein